MITTPKPETRTLACRVLELGRVFSAHGEAIADGRAVGFCVACASEQAVTAEDIEGDRCQCCGTLAVASAAVLILSGYLG